MAIATTGQGWATMGGNEAKQNEAKQNKESLPL
jgi:hypothetical protein